jgi:hypothetical protein
MTHEIFPVQKCSPECQVKDFFSNSTNKFSSMQILFLKPEAITGAMCTLTAEKEVRTAM